MVGAQGVVVVRRAPQQRAAPHRTAPPTRSLAANVPPPQPAAIMLAARMLFLPAKAGMADA